jgi:BirA family transcriptional regulator, biotin operon repressor / biotin---[acetyl-CoA-carboxylase] ligase
VAALAKAGAAEGLWLRADTQTGGKGRHGRSWVSPPGNLHASTLVRLIPGDPSPPTLALVAAVALDQLVTAYVDAGRAMLKWPNDLLVDGAKLSGILLERSGDAVVIGFGVNLAHHPEDLDRPATSLAAVCTSAPEPGLFLADLADSFAHWLARWREGLAPVRRRWLERAHPIGTPLSAQGADGVIVEGLFDGLDEGGALRLRLAGGSLHVIHAGDVFLIQDQADAARDRRR